MNGRKISTVALAGLGGIGLNVARALDRGIDGLSLAMITVRNTDRAATLLDGFQNRPLLVDPARLAEADIVVEAAPADAFRAVVGPAIERGRTLVIVSAGALLQHLDLVDRAHATGARILLASGALGGLDALRAAAGDGLESVTLVSSKPPRAFTDAPSDQRACLFRGNALQAAAAFPANANVAATLALAGIGPERTQVEIWSDPALTQNIHAWSASGSFGEISVRVACAPSAENPRSSRLASLSVIDCLRRLRAPLLVGG